MKEERQGQLEVIKKSVESGNLSPEVAEAMIARLYNPTKENAERVEALRKGAGGDSGNSGYYNAEEQAQLRYIRSDNTMSKAAKDDAMKKVNDLRDRRVSFSSGDATIDKLKNSDVVKGGLPRRVGEVVGKNPLYTTDAEIELDQVNARLISIASGPLHETNGALNENDLKRVESFFISPTDSAAQRAKKLEGFQMWLREAAASKGVSLGTSTSTTSNPQDGFTNTK
jgi:hypothetical protein